MRFHIKSIKLDNEDLSIEERNFLRGFKKVFINPRNFYHEFLAISLAPFVPVAPIPPKLKGFE